MPARREKESPLHRAIRLAASRLKRSPCSRARLIEHLLSKRCSESDAASAADEMTRLGFLDEAALADAVARAAERKGPVSRQAIESKAIRRGLDASATSAALDARFANRDPLTDALALVSQRLCAMPASLDAPTKVRRLYSLLARRGFDESIAEEAIRRTLGTDSTAE